MALSQLLVPGIGFKTQGKYNYDLSTIFIKIMDQIFQPDLTNVLFLLRIKPLLIILSTQGKFMNISDTLT